MDERTFYRLIGGIMGAIDECADGLEKVAQVLVKQADINKHQKNVNRLFVIFAGATVGYVRQQNKKIEKLSKDVKTLKTKGV